MIKIRHLGAVLLALAFLVMSCPGVSRADNSVTTQINTSFTLRGSSDQAVISLLPTTRSCTVETSPSATMGGGTITMNLAGTIVAQPVTGFPDPNSTLNGSQTITSAGVSLTIPIASKASLILNLSGASGAQIQGFVNCSNIPVNTMGLTNPAALTATPGGGLATQEWLLGTGTALYTDTVPDTFKDMHITSAATTALYSWSGGSAGSLVNSYIDLLAVQTSGTTNTGAVTFEYGYQTSTPCDTVIQTFPPDFSPNVGATGNIWTVSIGTLSVGSATGSNNVPAPWPRALPLPGLAGKTMQVCVVTTLVVNLYAYFKHAEHVN